MIDCGSLLLKYRGLDGAVQGRLKIGFVVGGARGPLWFHSLLVLLRSVTQFEIHLFSAGSGACRTPVTSSGLAERLYTWSRRKADPFGEVDLDFDGTLPEAVRESIRARELDLLCWIADESIPEGPCVPIWRDLEWSRSGWATHQLNRPIGRKSSTGNFSPAP